jgi:type IV secretory pathway VirB10-like protein
MSKVILAAIVAGALALTGLDSGRALAQTPPAKPATEKTDAKSDAKSETKSEAKSKAAEERKAKRAEAKKARAEKKAKASAARSAARERQKQCGTEWREAKKAGKIEKNQTWPKFWSACNARLKAKAG